MLPVQAKHLKSIEEIIRKNAYDIVDIKLASEYQDTRQATDMVVTVTTGTIAVRIRTFKSTKKKYRDFTVRSITRCGNKTEIDKLRDGWARWYVYAWENQAGEISEWMFIDMDKVRASKLLDTKRHDIPNGDGTFFRAYSETELRLCNSIVTCQL